MTQYLDTIVFGIYLLVVATVGILVALVATNTAAWFVLRSARIDVTEVPGKPGVYRAVAFLRPHFQLDELTVSLRLVAELPAAAK